MSKAAGGPAASAFNNPRKTGWLYKHGGSGISSHWKKRWFIADDHYLFYYKTPTEKKPVGILCLQEYGSCQKADVKEWKKSFSFILGRAEGNHENTDGGGTAAGKDYVLYSDSEGDMNAWIEALKEEMKSSGSYFNGNAFGYGGGSKVKVDQKAIEEVTKAASDGPKLTHLTAQRPRVKGRRPPKRYATYHEEDKDESPPDTPTFDRKIPSPQHTTPSSPSASPTSKSKGHRPAVPLIPKQRSITSSPPPTSLESPKTGKTLPIPPAKLTKEKEEVEADTVPVPKQRPIPPKRPLKPRAATDAPVTAPRPVPAPRKMAGKEGVVSPARDLPLPEGDKDVVLAENEPRPLSTQGTPTDEQKDSREAVAGDIISREEEGMAEAGEDRADSNPSSEIFPTSSRETSPSLKSQEKEKSRGDISTDREQLDVDIGSDNSSHVRHASSTDEYEHMKPGVTKEDHHVSSKPPEYDEPESKPCLHQEEKYATPSPLTKQKETTYDVPNSGGEENLSVVPTAPQISLVASENEENLTTGRGKSSKPQHSEEHLKPFKIERDALGYTKVMKQKSNDRRVRSESPVQSDEEPPPPPLWTGMDAGLVGDNVPSTLHQAREILHLAQIMKKEIEDMRREVQRELELARRERQDAELIKKNAIEILRMAKEKLSQKLPA